MKQLSTDSEYTVKSASTLSELRVVVSLQRAIWGYGSEGSDYPYPARALIALIQSGGLLSCAYCDDDPIGFALGWLGRTRESGLPYFHSQLLGVIAQHRGRGIGMKLKMHQKRYAQSCGLQLIRWTFDPLQSANARLNLHRLGGVANDYAVDLYGNLKSNLSSGIASDRLWINWHIDSNRVKQRLRPRDSKHGLPPIRQINPCSRVRLKGSHFLRTGTLDLDADEHQLLLEVPTDFDLMRRERLDLAQAWRIQVREAFSHYFSEGYLLDDFILHGSGSNLRGFYRLTRDTLEAVLASR